MRLIRVLFLVVATLYCGTAHAAEFIPLGDLFGGLVFSTASAVSDGGNFVVGSSKSIVSFNLNEGFSWTQSRGMRGLGDLPGGEFASSVFDVAADGSAIVGLGNTSTGNEAMLINDQGRLGLGDLPGGSISSAGRGISRDGLIVVGSSSTELGIEAFRWTEDAGMVGLDELPGGEFYSSAAAISGDNRTIVGVSASALGNEAFRWTATEGMIGLGDLPGGTFASEAMAVSHDGSIIVGNGRMSDGPQAIRWSSDDGMVGLGWLPNTTTWSEARSTTADGDTIVGFSGTGDSQQAFLWTQQDGLQNLQSFLEADFGLTESLAGWSLTTANDIAPDGKFIVGAGVNPSGDTEAWLVRLIDFLPGDYNANGQVEQGDLDLVLLNWGAAGFPAPAGWLQDLPIGAVNQQELDGVLLNWGNGTLATMLQAPAVPEPTSALLISLVIITLELRRPRCQASMPRWQFVAATSVQPNSCHRRWRKW